MKAIVPFAAKLITSILAVVYTYYVSKHLDKEFFGTYSSMLAITFVLSLITDWGFNVFGSQMIAQKLSHSEKIEFIHEAIYTKFWLCVFCSIIYLVICLFSSNGLYYLMGLPILFFGFLNSEWIARGLMQPQVAGYRQLIFSILNVCIFYLIYYFNFPKLINFIAYSLNSLISFLIIIPLIKNEINFSAFFKSKQFVLKNIRVKTTSIFFFGYVLNNLVYTSGILLLTFLSTDTVVGTYSSFYNVFATVIAPAAIAFSLFNPKKHVLSDNEFYKNYYLVMLSVILFGIVFYLKGDLFYHVFYPKNFEYNTQLNVFAAIAFVLYCIENMFVVNTIFNNSPKKYLKINLLGLSVLLISWFIFYSSNQVSAISAFKALVIAQAAMIVFSFFYYPKLAYYLKGKKLFSILLLICLAVVINFQFNGLLQYFLLATVALLAVIKTYPIIKNLYQ